MYRIKEHIVNENKIMGSMSMYITSAYCLNASSIGESICKNGFVSGRVSIASRLGYVFLHLG